MRRPFILALENPEMNKGLPQSRNLKAGVVQLPLLPHLQFRAQGPHFVPLAALYFAHLALAALEIAALPAALILLLPFLAAGAFLPLTFAHRAL